MLVFIDTNIFYGNWQLIGADFQLLFNYIDNTESKIIISEIVSKEVQNIYQRELGELIKSFLALAKKSRQFGNLIDRNNFEIETNENDYSFIQILSDKTNLVTIPFSSVKQEDVVDRCIAKKRPFQENEKGYRDTLIWLSLLEYLKKNRIKTDVAFITNNSDDFFSKKDNVFHPDLKEDIEHADLLCKIIPYTNLHSFIEDKIDKKRDKYSIAKLYDEVLCNIDDFLESESEQYFNGLNLTQSKDILRDLYSPMNVFLESIVKFSFEIIEGVEDPEIIDFIILNEGNMHINYRFNLRICSFKFTFLTSEYNRIKHSIGNEFFLEEKNEEYTEICFYPRVYLDSSFVFDPNTQETEGFEIQTIGLTVK